MTSPTSDPVSIAGKPLDVAETTRLLVIGAGPAGIAAALEAARCGLEVVLVDENPIPAESMGEDVPLLFGQRASGAVRNRNAMLEAVLASDPGIAEAFEAGVDVRLGTLCWGLYANGPSVGWLPGPVAGLADGERSWLIGCEHVVVAAGARDVGLAFPGWDQPGVIGAAGALRLSRRYGALEARRALVIGTTAEALTAALALREAGVKIVGVVEQAAAPVGPGALVSALDAAGVPILCGRVVARAEGGLSGVESAVVVEIDGEGRHREGTARRIACDTIVLGVGTAPAIELLEAAGCRTAFVPERGGYVPVCDEHGRCSVPGLGVAGDAAGVWPGKVRDSGVAAAEGRRVVRGLAASLGLLPPSDEPSPPLPDPDYGLAAYRTGWVRASVIEAEDEVHVCRCEEVTAREILEVRPPRYLGWNEPAPRNDRSLRTLLGDGVPHPDQVKRLTRAGMGLCQGRRCREQVQTLLALGAGVDLPAVPLASYRAPVRPLPLRLAGQSAEVEALREHWDTWFGMASQYSPPWALGEHYTAGGRRLDEKVASE